MQTQTHTNMEIEPIKGKSLLVFRDAQQTRTGLNAAWQWPEIFCTVSTWKSFIERLTCSYLDLSHSWWPVKYSTWLVVLPIHGADLFTLLEPLIYSQKFSRVSIPQKVGWSPSTHWNAEWNEWWVTESVLCILGPGHAPCPVFLVISAGSSQKPAHLLIDSSHLAICLLVIPGCETYRAHIISLCSPHVWCELGSAFWNIYSKVPWWHYTWVTPLHWLCFHDYSLFADYVS